MTDIKAEKVDEPEDSVNMHDLRHSIWANCFLG